MRAARATLIAVMFAGIFGQSTGQRPAFEVASVKPDYTSAPPSASPAPGGVRFVARNMPLNWLIGEAYLRLEQPDFRDARRVVVSALRY
jgi:hypothetical protein